MIIYNVTTKTDWSIHEDWLQWMKSEHIPEVLATGLFNDSRMMRLLDVDDSEGPTYAIQYYAASREDYNAYIRQFSESLALKASAKWGDKFVSFRSVLGTVN